MSYIWNLESLRRSCSSSGEGWLPRPQLPQFRDDGGEMSKPLGRTEMRKARGMEKGERRKWLALEAR